MGYVHDTKFSQFMAPNQAIPTAGTWTLAVASNVASYDRTAAAAAFVLHIPALVPSNSGAEKGVLLKSFEVMWSNATADLTAFTVKLFRDNFSPNANSGSGTINTATEITGITIDPGHDTAAERYAQDEHRMIVTLDEPVWIDNDNSYHLELGITAAAGSVFKYYGSIVNFTLRA